MAAKVKLYGAVAEGTGSLGSVLDLTVEAGAGGASADCTGFASSTTLLPSTPLASWTAVSYGTGLDSWAATGGAKRTYRFTHTVDPTACNAYQTASVSALFTWEADSTVS